MSQKKKVNPVYLWRLKAYLAPYAGYMMIALLLVLGFSAATLLGPWIVKQIVDQAIMPGKFDLMLKMTGVLVAVFVLGWLLASARTYLLSWIGQKVIFRLRMDLFEHLQTLSFRFFDRIPVGKLITRLTGDVDALNELVSGVVVNIVSELVILVGIIWVMFSLHVPLTWATLATIPLLTYMFTGFQTRLLDAEREVRNTASDVNTSLQESISGVRVTQAFAQEETNREKFQAVNERHYEACCHSIKVFSFFWPGVELFWVFSSIIVTGIGGYWLTRGDITVGTLAAFLGYTGSFFGPIRNLSQFLRVIQTAAAGAEKIFTILDTQTDVAEASDAYDLPSIQGRVELKEIEFSYDGEEMVLKGIDLVAEPGETIAIVGHTGAGKTSLINLLCGFYRPTRGVVAIDGHDLAEVTFASLRSQIGLVLQEPFLFSGTVRENMLFGKEEATDEAIWNALGIAGAVEFVQKLPQGLDTLLGERGAMLSMGQRQLLSFARAILADPRLLILDEATANIDTETEMQIQGALQELLKGRTAFVIAHRLSTIRQADRIVVVEDGQIVESGNHEELLAERGIYYRMTAAQAAV